MTIFTDYKHKDFFIGPVVHIVLNSMNSCVIIKKY